MTAMCKGSQDDKRLESGRPVVSCHRVRCGKIAGDDGVGLSQPTSMPQKN